MFDPRVQAIRCLHCHRLRPHPNTEGTLACMCGGRTFEASYPMPGEETWAVTIYEQELRKAGLWSLRLTMRRMIGR